MAFIDWSKEFSVGSPALDQQHMGLIALINQLHASLLKAAQKDELNRIFGELIRYTDSHFKSEEGMMRQASYPARAAHQLEHEEFVRQVLELHDQFIAGRHMVSMDLLKFLKKWLTDHILGSDQEYAPFLNPVQMPVESRN